MYLTLVKKIEIEKGTKSFFFKYDKKNAWKPGQYVVLTLEGIERQFTIASSPTEGDVIQITTRIREESEFKKILDSLEVGSKIESKGPFGLFVFDKNDYDKKHVFLAGGIGITPFRSIIKFCVDNKLKTNIHLIYSNSDDSFVFKEELDTWQTIYKFLKITYFNSSIKGHLNRNIILDLVEDSKDTIFWVVGPKAFVNSMEDILEEIGIPNENIKSEKFIGY
jgi:ferredoxin-NADP reductase